MTKIHSARQSTISAKKEWSDVKTHVVRTHILLNGALQTRRNSVCGTAVFRWVYFNCARLVSSHIRAPIPPELHHKYRAEADHKHRSIIDFNVLTIGMFPQGVDTGFLGFHKLV